MGYKLLALMCVMACAWAQAPDQRSQHTTTPVPILRQINEVNEDGTYTYGFEAADGTFKLETRDEEWQRQGQSVPVPAIPAVPAVSTVPQQQVSNPIAPQLPQLASLPLLPRPQQFRIVPQATQRPINIELDGFSEDRNEDGFVDGSPEEAAKPQLTAQQIQQQQQFLAGQQRLVPQQFAAPLPAPQQFVPQQFPAQTFPPNSSLDNP
nr:uncharacterized protein LOC113818065 [Penaeus vannamei]